MRLSIILPVHNLGDYLPFTLENLTLMQSGSDWASDCELIIIDDGSTDGSGKLLAEFAGRNPDGVRLITLPQSRGVSHARNVGLSMAAGDYVFFADGDDVVARGALPLAAKAADRARCDVLHFGYEEITPEDYERMKTVVPDAEFRPDDVVNETSREFLDRTNGLIGPPVALSLWQNVFSRRFLADAGCGFNENLIVGEDALFMWRIMLKAASVSSTTTPLYFYQLRAQSAIRNAGQQHLKELSKSRIAYVEALEHVGHRLAEDGYGDPALHGLNLERRNAFYSAVCGYIVTGCPLREIVGYLKNYKASGGDIRPGRPRFHDLSRLGLSLNVKLKRWLVAYPIALSVKYGLI